MFSKRLTLLLGLLPLLAACGSDDRDEALQESRIQRLIDERRFDEAITLLEPALSEAPADKGLAQRPDDTRLKYLLAEAHLGMARFEIVSFGARVLDEQSLPQPALDKLIPACPTERVQDLSFLEARCLVRRLLGQLPAADDEHFKRARELLRAAYPEPAQTPRDINLLIGLVEIGSSFSRLGALLVRYQSLDAAQASGDDINGLFALVATAAEEALNGLSRAKDAPAAVTRYLTGFESMPLFNQNAKNLDYVAAVGLPTLMKIQKNGNDLSAQLLRVLVIQKLDEVVESFKAPRRP